MGEGDIARLLTEVTDLDRGKALDAELLGQRLCGVGGAVHLCERDGLVAALERFGGRLPFRRQFLQLGGQDLIACEHVSAAFQVVLIKADNLMHAFAVLASCIRRQQLHTRRHITAHLAVAAPAVFRCQPRQHTHNA
jgi:hypothetical protein